MPSKRRGKANTVLGTEPTAKRIGRPPSGRGYSVTVYLNRELAELVGTAAKAEGYGKGKEAAQAWVWDLVRESV